MEIVRVARFQFESSSNISWPNQGVVGSQILQDEASTIMASITPGKTLRIPLDDKCNISTSLVLIVC